MVCREIWNQTTGSYNKRIVQTYLDLFSASGIYEAVEIEGFPLIVDKLKNQRGDPPAFYLTSDFYNKLQDELMSLYHQLPEKEFHEFASSNSHCPYPVVVFHADTGDFQTIVLGVSTDAGDFYIVQAFFDNDKGGKVLFLNSKDGRIDTVTINEDEISTPESWLETEPYGGNSNMEDAIFRVIGNVALSNAAMKTNGVDLMPVNGRNRPVKLKNRQDEHKMYRVRLDNAGECTRKSPLLYVPRRKHDVRGHFRNYKSGKRVWVRNHSRGDEALGIITKDYVIGG